MSKKERQLELIETALRGLHNYWKYNSIRKIRTNSKSKKTLYKNEERKIEIIEKLLLKKKHILWDKIYESPI